MEPPTEPCPHCALPQVKAVSGYGSALFKVGIISKAGLYVTDPRFGFTRLIVAKLPAAAAMELHTNSGDPETLGRGAGMAAIVSSLSCVILYCNITRS